MHLVKREFEQAITAIERAGQLAPNHSYVAATQASILAYTENPAEALVQVQKAIRQKPITPPWFYTTLAVAHYNLGEFESAIGEAAQAISSDQNELEARVYKAAAHEALGRHGEAAGEVREVLQIDPGFSLSVFAATQPYKDQAVLDQLARIFHQ